MDSIGLDWVRLGRAKKETDEGTNWTDEIARLEDGDAGLQ